MSRTSTMPSTLGGSAEKTAFQSFRFDWSNGPTTWQFGLMLGLMVVLAFPDIVFGSATFVFRDYALFGYPLAAYHKECFWRGEIPLWNPLNNAGIPFLAQWNTMVLYPFSAIYLLLPLPWSLGFFCLAHLMLGGVGMFVLARRWTGSATAAGLAGVAFTFNGLTLSCLIWPNNIAALGWMPWVMFLADDAWRKGGRAMLLAAWAGAVQMLAGAPEIFIFTWLIIGSLWGVRCWKPPVGRAQWVGRGAAVVGLVTALTAAQLFPFVDLLAQSHRDTSYGGLRWSMPGLGWANLFLPLFRCTRTAVGVYLQCGQAWASSYYPGVFMLALAIAAAFWVRSGRVRMLAALLGIALVFSLGEDGYLYPLLQRVLPVLGFMRFPIKWVVVANVVVPILAAFSLAHLFGCEQSGRRFSLKTVSALIFAAVTAIIAFLLWFARQFPGTTEEVKWDVLAGNGISRVVIVGLLLLLLNYYFKTAKRGVTALLLMVGVYVDGVTHAPRQNPGVNPVAYTMQIPSLEEKPKPRHGESRAMPSLDAIDTFYTTDVPTTFDFMLGMRMGLYENVNLLEGIPKLDGFYSLYLPHETEVRKRIFSDTNTVRAGLADFLGIKWFSSPEGIFQWDVRPTSLPLVTAGQQPEFLDATNTLKALIAPNFNPAKVVYLDPADKVSVSKSEASEARITSQSVSSHRIAFDVESKQGGLAVIAQAYYARWSARVDGQKVPLLRANHAFQAVPISAGTQHVELTYEDWPFRIGVMVSVLIGLCTGVIWMRTGPICSLPKDNCPTSGQSEV